MSDGVQRIVDDLAGELNRSVIVDTPAIQVRAVSRHFGDEDGVRIHGILQRQAPDVAIAHILDQGVQDWIHPGVIPAAADLHMKRRLCCPIRWHGELLGFLFIIDADDTLTEEEQRATELAANMAASVMIRESQENQKERAAAEAVFQQLLSTDADETRAVIRTLIAEHRIHDDDIAIVAEIEVTPTSPDHRERAELILRETLETTIRHRPEDALLYRGSASQATLLYIGAADRVDTHAPELLHQLTATIERTLGPSAEPCRTGTSYAPDLFSIAAAHDRAGTALQATKRVAHIGHLAAWEDLGYYAPLMHLPDDTLRRTIPPAIRTLLDVDPSRDLLRTAEVFLDAAGTSSVAATKLHVHRTTLYYRLNRIQETTGLDLQDGNNRLTLHLGLKAARICGYF
jgi:sugar diacid utilization regulator